jgi:hypothetical protein
MKQCQKYSDRANLKPYSDQQLNLAQEAYSQILEEYGKDMGSDYGWASEDLGKSRPTLFDLEESTGLDHWRPRFRWASQHLHAPYRGADKLLAVAGQELLLVGPSNYGLTDPAHQLAISLTLATVSLLLLEPNIDRLVICGIMLEWSDQVGQSFFAVDPKLN